VISALAIDSGRITGHPETIHSVERHLLENGVAATRTEDLACSRLATSAQPPRTTSLFSLHVSSQHAPQPMRLIVPLETPGALLEGLRCLTASRPLSTPEEF